MRTSSLCHRHMLASSISSAVASVLSRLRAKSPPRWPRLPRLRPRRRTVCPHTALHPRLLLARMVHLLRPRLLMVHRRPPPRHLLGLTVLPLLPLKGHTVRHLLLPALTVLLLLQHLALMARLLPRLVPTVPRLRPLVLTALPHLPGRMVLLRLLDPRRLDRMAVARSMPERRKWSRPRAPSATSRRRLPACLSSATQEDGTTRLLLFLSVVHRVRLPPASLLLQSQHRSQAGRPPV